MEVISCDDRKIFKMSSTQKMSFFNDTIWFNLIVLTEEEAVKMG